MSLNMNERAVDVSNMDNSVSRWENALNFYRESCANIRSARSKERVRCVAIMDISHSMDGTRFICEKLGLCSLLANFEADDEVNVITFASNVNSVTDGFKAVSDLTAAAPQVLHNMRTDGCTACYDAIVKGIVAMRDRASLYQSFAATATDVVFKNVAIVLTDGEDNESSHTSRSVERFLVNPGIINFTFLMVAVDMTRQAERKFRSWMDLNHCKQVRVNVRTGSSLVGVFKEMILCRILQTEVTSIRFLQRSAGDSENGGCSEEEQFRRRRAALLRQAPGGDLVHPNVFRSRQAGSDSDSDDNYEGDCDYFSLPGLVRNASEGVLSVNSCSSGGGDLDHWRSEDDDDGTIIDDDDNDGDSLPPPPTLFRHRTYDSVSSVYDSDNGDDFDVKVCDHSAVSMKDNVNVSDHDSTGAQQYPSECYCPISHSIMTDPVLCADGHTYERKNIESWLAQHSTSPNTNIVLPHKHLLPNHSLRNLILSLTRFAKEEALPLAKNEGNDTVVITHI